MDETIYSLGKHRVFTAAVAQSVSRSALERGARFNSRWVRPKGLGPAPTPKPKPRSGTRPRSKAKAKAPLELRPEEIQGPNSEPGPKKEIFWAGRKIDLQAQVARASSLWLPLLRDGRQRLEGVAEVRGSGRPLAEAQETPSDKEGVSILRDRLACQRSQWDPLAPHSLGSLPEGESGGQVGILPSAAPARSWGRSCRWKYLAHPPQGSRKKRRVHRPPGPQAHKWGGVGTKKNHQDHQTKNNRLANLQKVKKKAHLKMHAVDGGKAKKGRKHPRIRKIRKKPAKK